MLEVRVLPVASGRDRRAALNVAGPADDPPQAQAAGECRTARYLSAAAERTGAPEPGCLMWARAGSGAVEGLPHSRSHSSRTRTLPVRIQFSNLKYSTFNFTRVVPAIRVPVRPI
jgi:hypothetical protein